ncbi:ribonuclease H-like domain-containing protein [Tanacetum coccineum]
MPITVFQSLLSQLEIHGAGVSTEDANQKFLRSLPSAWSQVSLIMRTKPGVDSLSFDDLYNNLRVFESDVKGSTASSSSSQNVHLCTENTTVLRLCPQLDHEDLEQIDEYDLEEMDLKWQVAMISMRMKFFYKKTGRKLQFNAKEPVGFDKTKVECYRLPQDRAIARECRSRESRNRRRMHVNFLEPRMGAKLKRRMTLKHCSDSDTEVISCSNKCKESYANLKKLYDAQREQLSDASIEIKAYSQGLKKVEAQLVAHQQGQLWYEQKIKFMKIDLDDKTDVLTYHKKLLAEAQKEKEDLKAKVEKWQNSSKNLSKLLNTQMSANDKFGLGYGDHRYDGILSYENEVLQSVFMNKESELENQPLNDRFADGMHAVPPPMTGNYMPSGPEIEIDYSQFTYDPKQTQPSESKSQSSEFDTYESNISTEPSELVYELVVNEPNVECQPKVWSDAHIIKEYESDSEDECVPIPTKQQETPSFANKQVKTPRETVKDKVTHSQKPKVDKKDLGYGFAVRACFVCGSLNHLIKDCDFYEKRMARKAELNNGWNNVQRVNKQNQFVPSAVLTRTGIIPVNTARTSGTKIFSTARQSVNRQTVLTNIVMKVNTVKPIMNIVRPANVFHKTHSPSSRPFKNTTVLSTNFSKQKVYTNKVNAVSVVGGKRETVVKSSAGCNWRPQRYNWNNDYPHRALKNKGIVDSGCSRHMTGIKAYLAEFQEFNGGPVAFGGSKGYITGFTFIVYQMDVKSAFLYGKIDEENGYRRGTIDKTLFLKKDKHDIILVQVYVDDIIFGSTKKSWCDEFESLMKSRFQMSSMGELIFFLGLQVKQTLDGIFINQDKYVAEILKKFDFKNVKTASTPIETQKPLVKDEEASDVDVHLYRSMIGSLMYLTASRPDIMFAVCACSRFQVTPKSSHLSAVKRIFRYLKGKPKMGLWYPKVSSFDLESYSDSDYAGANLDRKSTTGGCQFLGRRLISWQCKKQTIVATSTTEAEYVAAASCCGQNQVYHSKTKHIAIRHHFIRDAYEKKLIQVLKIHTDDNVADLLTKAFDVSRGLIGFRESLRRVIDGTEALLIPTLFILWLDTVSTDSAKLVPLGKVCTAIETLKKNTAKALISLLTTITLSTTMAVLDSCPKHNMVAYLEKSEGNAEFHEIIDFLTRSSIHHALTVSPVVSTTFVEQFWTSAKSKIINNVRHITAKVAGKPMYISEASIRSDLLFNDANGIDSLPNQAIFNAIQLMGYEGDLTVLTFNKALFSPQWRFLFHTMNHCISSKSTSWNQIPTNIVTAVICLTSNQKYNFSKLIFDGMLRHLDAKKKFVMYPRFISIFLDKQLANVPVPLDHFPVNALTSKVFSFMVKKGKHFSGKVTPLFASMLVQPTEDEGAPSERPSEAQPTPSPAHTSEVPIEPQTDPSPRPSPSTIIPDSIPESSGGNLGGHSSSDKSLSGNEGDMTLKSVYDLCLSLCAQVSDQAKEIQHLKAQITKLKKQAKPVIKHHRAWLKSVSLQQRFSRKSFSKKQRVHKESVSKQGWKFAKGESSVQRDPLFDAIPEDVVDHMETENAHDEGRTREMVDEDKEIDENILCTEDVLSTDKEGVSTDMEKVSTDRQIVSTDGSKVSNDRQIEGTEDDSQDV